MIRRLFIVCLLMGVTMMMKAAKVTIDRIDPTDWYVGMNRCPY